MGTTANVLVGVAAVSIRYPIGGSYVAVGYTEDGVSVNYTPTYTDIEVEEEVNPVRSMLTKEVTEIIVNMAETSLFNIDKAIAGSILAGSVITIGGGTAKEMSVKVVGKNPAGFDRTIECYKCVATGTVGMKFRKNEKTVCPVTFKALKETGHDVMTITDSAS